MQIVLTQTVAGNFLRRGAIPAEDFNVPERSKSAIDTLGAEIAYPMLLNQKTPKKTDIAPK